MSDLELVISDGIARLIINRPSRKNALSSEMWAEIPLLLKEASGVRALAVQSATAGVFSAGADINEYRENAGNSEWGFESQARIGRAFSAPKRTRSLDSSYARDS